MSHNIIKINGQLGRPRWKIIRSICKSLDAGAPILAACATAGISVMTLWRWREKWPKLDRMLGKIYDSRTQVAEDMLFKNVMSGSTKDIHFFLMNRAKSRFNKSPDASNVGVQVFGGTGNNNGNYRTEDRQLQERIRQDLEGSGL